MNTFEQILVADDLASKGVTNYTLRPGNNCVWVSYGRINCYYFIQEGRIVDVVYD